MIPVLVGLGVLIGGAILLASWDEVVDWLTEFIPKIKAVWQSVRRYVPSAVRIWGDIIVEEGCKIAEIICQFRNTDNELIEEIRKVDLDEVPPSILEKLGPQRRDITKPMGLILGQEI